MNRLQQLKRARIALIHKWINRAGKIRTYESTREIAYNRACLHYYRGEWETLEGPLNYARHSPYSEGSRDPYFAAFARILKQEARRNVAK